MSNYKNEAELREAVRRELRSHFRFHDEVKGIHCSGRKLRVDSVIEPVDPVDWKDESPAVAVEFKQPRGSFDTRDFTAWSAQAVSYTHTEWGHWGRLLVFACPSPLEGLRAAYGDPAVRLMERMLGQLGVGELVHSKRTGWTLRLSGHRMWSEAEGVRDARRWSLRPRSGSR